MDAEQPKEQLPQLPLPPMTGEQFANHVNELVGLALTSGACSFADIVSTLEFAKSDVIEIARAQAQQVREDARPRIYTPGGPGN